MTPRCKSCHFFVGDKRGGECRRNPPTMVMAPAKNALGAIDMFPSAAFPPVTTETWCGEFKSDTLMRIPEPGSNAWHA